MDIRFDYRVKTFHTIWYTSQHPQC